MPDFVTDTSDEAEVAAPPDEPEEDDGPSPEELEAAEVPGPQEEERKAKAAKEEERQQPQARDQQVDNLNRALRQAREEKRAAKRLAAEQAARTQRLEQRHEVFMRRLAEANGVDISDLVPTQPKLPDQEQDPIGHLTAQMRQMVDPLQREIADLKGQLTERELNGQVAAVDSYVADDAAAFHAEHSDYDQAEDFVLEGIARNAWNGAKARYPDADEDDLAAHVEQYIGRAIGNLKVGAYRDRKSLAAIVYSVAQQWGWQAAAVAEQSGNGNGRRPARGKVGELQRNLQKSGATVRGLERSPRKAPPSSLAALGDLDDDEFDELTSKPGAWKKLVESAAGQ